MDIQRAVNGMLNIRGALRTERGVKDAHYISEMMQRLTQYTSAIEECLAELEEQLEVEEMTRFLRYANTEKRSVSQAAVLAKQEVGSLKGEIAKLKRYVHSSWSVIGVAQSRVNHLHKTIVGQI